MIGFRSKTPWKMMCAICYYGVCLTAFNLPLNKAIGICILAYSVPVLAASMYDLYIKQDQKQLFSIPSFIFVLTVSFLLYSSGSDDASPKEEISPEASIGEVQIENVVSAIADTTQIIDSVNDVSQVIDTNAFSDTVYVTRSGGKYHRPDCRFVKDREVSAYSVAEAQRAGKTPCSKCIGS